jgi:hypothetical protein
MPRAERFTDRGDGKKRRQRNDRQERRRQQTARRDDGAENNKPDHREPNRREAHPEPPAAGCQCGLRPGDGDEHVGAIAHGVFTTAAG